MMKVFGYLHALVVLNNFSCMVVFGKPFIESYLNDDGNDLFAFGQLNYDDISCV